jgi:hypothetical protein
MNVKTTKKGKLNNSTGSEGIKVKRSAKAGGAGFQGLYLNDLPLNHNETLPRDGRAG